ncbi:chemoreceptor glutamine deamidase/glutamate methylesterase CheD [Athalassotoga saccharophila]|uniref:chemoreceptor glutamine deamidase/glutamate methylesterase CheD n=1 Tax=Athalassotoga saccharophila TaxID=1441386 RepID=UPI001379AB2D|nr:chemoreceptor glutamine deamidase/glutamate methylesterase CheD [Athalassotoga saccharophila]BBJ27277.1 chemotaxis protein CheD [Athalassotoga saccharophila]
MEEKLIIGIGEFKVAKNPAILVTLGLGSCVGVCLRDKKSHIGGMIHVMLPELKDQGGNPGKYAEPGIRVMVNEMVKMGANVRDMEAKIAGGASMFESKGFEIGKKNVDKIKDVLRDLGIRILAEDTGGNRARSIEYKIEDGTLMIKKVGGKESIEIIQI